MNFAEKVKNLRINADLTQQELSKYLGISASAIGYLENGQRDPTGSTLISYAKHFNVSIDSLVGLEPDIEDSIFSTAPAAPSLSPDEARLLETFRKLNVKNRIHVSTYAEIRLEEQDEDGSSAFRIK